MQPSGRQPGLLSRSRHRMAPLVVRRHPRLLPAVHEGAQCHAITAADQTVGTFHAAQRYSDAAVVAKTSFRRQRLELL